jgi:serine/threonine protein kinase
MVSNDLFLVFFILAICYTSIFLYTGLRSLNLKHFVSYWSHAKLLYYFQLIELALRMISFWLICFLNKEIGLEEVKFAFIILSIPETIIISCYVILAWIMLTSNLITRFNTVNEYTGSIFLNSKRSYLKWVRFLIIFFLVFWILLDTILYVLMLCSVLSIEDIVMQHSILCFVLTFIVIIIVTINICKYSGVPYKNEESRIIMRKVMNVIFIWTLGRIIHGVLYLIRIDDLTDESLNLGNIQDPSLVPTITFIFDLFSTEIICFIFVVDYSFFRIFLNEVTDFHKTDLVENLGPMDVYQSQLNLYAELEDIEIKDNISDKPQKLGCVYKGTYCLRPAAIRRITLPKANKYISERLYEDINDLSVIICPHFLTPIGLSIRNNIIDIIYPLASKSLHDLIENEYNALSHLKKLEISREISFCIKVFHDQDKVHGHITSYNILINNDTVLVTDLGLDHLKKYLGLTCGYVNKSSWTSPEVLKETGYVVTKSSKADDSYSFGIVLWELMTGEKPFPDVPLKELRNMITEGYRPEIPLTVPKEITELLKSCWNTDPKSRPGFELIHKTLCNIIAGDDATSSFSNSEYRLSYRD